IAVVKHASPAATPAAPTPAPSKTVPSSSTSLCIVCTVVHNTQMPTAAIVGTAGYTGQETLDRLLGHPSLEVRALGSDSHAGKAAQSLDPRLNGSLPAFVSNEDAARGGADVFFL